MMEAAARPSRATALTVFVVILLVSAAYQACFCLAMSQGDLTGLFFIGGVMRQPPERTEGFSYPDSTGYDGQFYRLLAHDPLLGKGYRVYFDDARYRSRRVLIPAVAALLGAGSPVAVDFWYVAITDVLIALGGVCFVFLTFPRCRPPVSILLYLFIPAIIASTDRMVLDGPSVAGFLAVWLFLRDERYGPLLAVLTALPLLREANLCVTVGCMLVFLKSRDGRRIVLCALTVIPSLAWWWYVAAHTPPSPAARLVLSVPLLPLVIRLFKGYPGNAGPLEMALLRSLAVMGVLCLLGAFAWLAKAMWDESREDGGIRYDTLLILPTAILGAFAENKEVLASPYAFMRVNSMLLVWVALRLMNVRTVWAAIYLPASSLALAVFRASVLFRFITRVVF